MAQGTLITGRHARYSSMVVGLSIGAVGEEFAPLSGGRLSLKSLSPWRSADAHRTARTEASSIMRETESDHRLDSALRCALWTECTVALRTTQTQQPDAHILVEGSSIAQGIFSLMACLLCWHRTHK